MAFTVESKKVEYACATCGTAFMDWPSQRHGRKFCSHSCYAESLKGKEPHNKGRKSQKECVNCGAAFNCEPSKKRKFCSQSCSGKFYSGEKHPLWRGGSHWRKEAWNSGEYVKWRLSVIVRDGGRCARCASNGVYTTDNLEVHHIVPISSDPTLILRSDNAITLCRACHNLTRGKEDQFAKELSGLIGTVPVAAPACNRKDRTPVPVDKETLVDLYTFKRMSSGEIAAMFGCTPEAIQKHLRKHGIKRRNPRESQIESMKRRSVA